MKKEGGGSDQDQPPSSELRLSTETDTRTTRSARIGNSWMVVLSAGRTVGTPTGKLQNAQELEQNEPDLVNAKKKD